MPAPRYFPQQLAGITAQNGGIPSDARERILASILHSAEEGVQAYQIGGRSLNRYALKDRIDLWAMLGAASEGLTGRAIQVRRGIPTDT